jgi:mannose-6-phosphate isomerase-like protein (cupin superfamily)
MKKFTLAEGRPHIGPTSHDAMTTWLQGGITGLQDFWVGVVYALPGGGANLNDSTRQRVWVVLSGEMSFKTRDGEVTLKPMESVWIQANEGVETLNKTHEITTMMLIMTH